jgi:hypothetical protein
MTALVVGEVLVDLVWRIDAALGSPETPCPARSADRHRPGTDAGP